MKLYQPIYLDKDDKTIVSVSREVFATKEQALGFGRFIAKRDQVVEVLELNLEDQA